MFDSAKTEAAFIGTILFACGLYIITTQNAFVTVLSGYFIYRLWHIQATSKVIKQLSDSVNTDELTNVFNRRGLISKFREMKDDRRQSGQSVLILDIDHFKQVNDTYGHDVGDKVLKQFAEVVSTNCRAEDVVGRWGGEEFVVILNETNYAKAYYVAEKIRKAVEDHSFAVPDITVSIGSNSGFCSNSLDEAVAIADKGLYQAKEKGRNCVAIAPSL